ncbi:hypothetical protein [Anaplasma phagocytophilum]|uniref:IgA FC receptor n=1 Tax=Anaplasma phagocytophilum str. NCH-1 TaxID=1359161 RepID=A0A0F3NLC8_ANAPH|nr:hypothetical protein [Anaplasma phagocytophilum]AGR79728.1 hypothetical protein YYU_05990 [Anaplasma phagocytophilum str. HZ2]AGR79752.1 hypothetical protein YYU_06280 [Anaplasma phagocytophilum str. HZ2]KJV68456.1 hypothetical protein EPHNCH_0139 [Anaplasma phagocytophilum str. NCH-1]KJV68566.1 hypothetical protein EPHNCH_0067 [Anaplasma phagocytophilum str. NCH-1]KJV86376.1 hypothetical protein APHNYW_1405 [Anaplasma phagocytophilum str. ApNYW]
MLDAPEIPKVPQIPRIPEIPGIPEISEIPEMPEMPRIPEAPKMPKFPRSLIMPSFGTLCYSRRVNDVCTFYTLNSIEIGIFLHYWCCGAELFIHNKLYMFCTLNSN